MADAVPHLLIFVNMKSGGGQGKALVERFQRCPRIDDACIFDLADGGPRAGLEAFAEQTDYSVLVCGGDGTIGWVLSVLDHVDFPYLPPIATLPLGTGNDLARALGWGGGYGGGDIVPCIDAVLKAEEVLLDRWAVEIAPMDTTGHPIEFERTHVLNNYFSIGVDAKVALNFHSTREANPELFRSRTKNKFWYFEMGAKAGFCGCPRLREQVQILCDGVEVELPKKAQGVMVLNIPSYAGGTNMWGKKVKDPWVAASMSDGLLEVVSVKSTGHMGRIRAKLGKAAKLGQAREVVVRWLQPVAIPCQVDGEPWLQQPAEIHISHLNQAKMLRKV